MNTKRSSKQGLGATFLSVFLAAGVVFPAIAQDTPKGLIIYVSTPGLGPEVARAVECSSINEFDRVINVRPIGAGKEMRLVRGQVLEILPYPNFGGSLTSADQVAGVRAGAERLAGMLVKYPMAKTSLQAAKNRFDFAVQQFDQNQILVAGSWVPRPAAASSAGPGGDVLAQLTVTDALGTKKVYRNVKIVSFDGETVRILHAAGSAAIKAEALPKEIRDKLKMTAAPVTKENASAPRVLALPPDQALEVVMKAFAKQPFNQDEASAAIAGLEATGERIPNNEDVKKLKSLAVAVLQAEQVAGAAQINAEQAEKEHARLLEEVQRIGRTSTRQGFEKAYGESTTAREKSKEAIDAFKDAQRRAGSARTELTAFAKEYRTNLENEKSRVVVLAEAEKMKQAEGEEAAKAQAMSKSLSGLFQSSEVGISTIPYREGMVSEISRLVGEQAPSSSSAAIMEKGKLYVVSDESGTCTVAQKTGNMILMKGNRGLPFAIVETAKPELLEGVSFQGLFVECLAIYRGDREVEMASGAVQTFPVFEAQLMVGPSASWSDLIVVNFKPSGEEKP